MTELVQFDIIPCEGYGFEAITDLAVASEICYSVIGRDESEIAEILHLCKLADDAFGSNTIGNLEPCLTARFKLTYDVVETAKRVVNSQIKIDWNQYQYGIYMPQYEEELPYGTVRWYNVTAGLPDLDLSEIRFNKHGFDDRGKIEIEFH